MEKASSRIIVALDVDSTDRAFALVSKLSPHVGGFKIGLEFFHAVMASVITPVSDDEACVNLLKARMLFNELAGKVFWDGKFNDIPNTIGGATKAVAAIQVKMFNVHASAGIDGMRAAVQNKGAALVLAVTVLTSFKENPAHITFGAPSKAKVLQFARDAKYVGCDGIICSPHELALLSSEAELAGLLKVTPGIRSEGDPPDDQGRTMTAGEAIAAGADYLVIGRPITKAPDPVAAAQKITAEIQTGLVARVCARK